MFYTQAEVTKFHRHFQHPSTEKLADLLKLAIPGDLPKETRAQQMEFRKHAKYALVFHIYRNTLELLLIRTGSFSAKR
jgi:hypothetical protein